MCGSFLFKQVIAQTSKTSNKIYNNITFLEMPTSYRLFLSNKIINNAKLKLAKNQAKAKQYPELELLLFGNYSLCHPSYLPKIAGHIFKNIPKQVRLF